MPRAVAFAALIVSAIQFWSGAVQAQAGHGMLESAADALIAGKPDQAFEEAMSAAALIAQTMPFSIHRAVLTEDSTQAFGMDAPRESNRYAPGEDIEIYLEPRGYSFERKDELFAFGYTVDLVLMDEAGSILGGQVEFGSWRFESRRPNLESFITLTVSLNDIPAGNYILELRVHDIIVDDVSVTTKLPVEISG